MLTAGGARGAYQAGVLRRLAEFSSRYQNAIPFNVIVGASTGAINGMGVSMHPEDFRAVTTWLSNLWRRLRPQDVFRTDLPAVGGNAFRWVRDLSVGAVLGSGHARALLDTSPLRRLMGQTFHTESVTRGIDRGILYALCVATTDMNTGQTVLFVQGAPGHPIWKKSRRVAVPALLTADHVMASSAIPVLFEPVRLSTPSGPSYFGDGCLRLFAPLGPAIRLGADRILAVGLRSKLPSRAAGDAPPTLAQTVGVSLSTIFMDHLDSDVEHLKRINALLAAGALRREVGEEPMRPVRVLHIAPSVDVSEVAREYAHRMPIAVRYLLGGWGADDSSTEILSYLLFDRQYTSALEDLGYRDAAAYRDEFEDFLELRTQSKRLA